MNESVIELLCRKLRSLSSRRRGHALSIGKGPRRLAFLSHFFHRSRDRPDCFFFFIHLFFFPGEMVDLGYS